MKTVDGVKLIAAHLNKRELNFLDRLQGFVSKDPETGCKQYPGLHAPFENENVQRSMLEGHYAHGGRVHPGFEHLLDEESPSLFKALAQQGRHGDDSIAWLPEDVAALFDHIKRGKPSLNPVTGLPEYFDLSGILSGAWNSIKSAPSQAWNWLKQAPVRGWNYITGGGQKAPYSQMNQNMGNPQEIPVQNPMVAPGGMADPNGRAMQWANIAGENVYNAQRSAQPYIANAAGAAGALSGGNMWQRATKAALAARGTNTVLNNVIPATTTLAQGLGHLGGSIATDAQNIAQNIPQVPGQLQQQVQSFFNNPLSQGSPPPGTTNFFPDSATNWLNQGAHNLVNSPLAQKIGTGAGNVGRWMWNKVPSVPSISSYIPRPW